MTTIPAQKPSLRQAGGKAQYGTSCCAHHHHHRRRQTSLPAEREKRRNNTRISRVILRRITFLLYSFAIPFSWPANSNYYYY